MLICILKPDASQGRLPIYNGEFDVLLGTSPCQKCATYTSTYNSDLGVVFVHNAVPWLIRHDSSILNHNYMIWYTSGDEVFACRIGCLFRNRAGGILKPLHVVRPQSNKT